MPSEPKFAKKNRKSVLDDMTADDVRRLTYSPIGVRMDEFYLECTTTLGGYWHNRNHSQRDDGDSSLEQVD